jgi:hypothetical protein
MHVFGCNPGGRACQQVLGASIRRALGFCETLKGEGGPQNTPERSPQIAQRISNLAIIKTGNQDQKKNLLDCMKFQNGNRVLEGPSHTS